MHVLRQTGLKKILVKKFAFIIITLVASNGPKNPQNSIFLAVYLDVCASLSSATFFPNFFQMPLSCLIRNFLGIESKTEDYMQPEYLSLYNVFTKM